MSSVNGKWVGAESGAKFDVHNPMNGAVIGGAGNQTKTKLI